MSANPKPFEPMLACSKPVNFDVLELVDYPVLMQPKFDGIRCVTIPVPADVASKTLVSQPFSRTLKRIPNKGICRLLAGLPPFLDGELMRITDEGKFSTYSETESLVMSRDGEGLFTYVLFDLFDAKMAGIELDYGSRLQALQLANSYADNFPIQVVETFVAETPNDVKSAYSQLLKAGYEGAILRSSSGHYKFGRSTKREKTLFKLKPKADAEAVIIELIALEHNTNAAFESELGRTKRSTAKEGRIADAARMGSLRVRGLNGDFKGLVFNIGTGFDDATRLNPPKVGEVVTFEFSPDPGYQLPRHPVFKRVRPEGA